MDATSQLCLRSCQVLELLLQPLRKILYIVGSSVGQITLQQTPDAFIGIELGGVGRKVFKV